MVLYKVWGNLTKCMKHHELGQNQEAGGRIQRIQRWIVAVMILSPGLLQALCVNNLAGMVNVASFYLLLFILAPSPRLFQSKRRVAIQHTIHFPPQTPAEILLQFSCFFTPDCCVVLRSKLKKKKALIGGPT